MIRDSKTHSIKLTVVSELNNYLESHADEFEECSGGCTSENIVTDFGFGFIDACDHIYHVCYEDYEVCPVPLEKLHEIVSIGLTTENVMYILNKCSDH